MIWTAATWQLSTISGHKHDPALVTWNVFVGDEKYMDVKRWVFSVPVRLPTPLGRGRTRPGSLVGCLNSFFLVSVRA
ncbi:hypothetical protein ACFFHJ_15540 [Planotetraspora thailandica]|nr:hypothetical protein [Planotetraspora thailandica]